MKFEVSMIRHLVRASILALVCAASTISTATARTIYDGQWSVLIVTQQGTCDRAYRYGVQIVDGNVLYDGGGPISLSGRVAQNGTVRVSVSAGGSRADGAGRLSRNVGSGNWQGRSGSEACSGYWQAERRG
jgi:hypothetical protein